MFNSTEFEKDVGIFLCKALNNQNQNTVKYNNNNNKKETSINNFDRI